MGMEERERRLISIAIAGNPETVRPILESYRVDVSIETMDQHPSALESKVVEAIEGATQKEAIPVIGTVEDVVPELFSLQALVEGTHKEETQSIVITQEPKLSALTKTGIYIGTYMQSMYNVTKAIFKYTTIPILLPLLPERLQEKITESVTTRGTERAWCNFGSGVYDASATAGTGMYVGSLIESTDGALIAGGVIGGVAGLLATAITRGCMYDREMGPGHKQNDGTYGPLIVELPTSLLYAVGRQFGNVNAKARYSIEQKEKALKEITAKDRKQ